MCDATTAVMAFGAVVSAYGQYQQGRSAQEAANYNAAVSRNNQKVSMWQAEDARQRGAEEARRQRIKTRGLIGQQKSALASNGIALDVGSPLELLIETAENGELDALTIEANAEREAYGHEVRANNYMAQAGLQDMQGEQAAQAGMFGAGSTILTTGGNIYSQHFAPENMSLDPFSTKSSSVPIPKSKPARF